MLRNVKARHFRRQAYPRSRWEWKYPCCLRKTVETCRMVKRDEPNHHTISHTPLFLARFCRKVGFYACPTRPLLHVAAFEGGVESTIMVIVMHAQCRHEAVQRAHGIQPLFRRAFLRMAQYINGAGQMRLCLRQGGHILNGKQVEKSFIGRTDDALQGGSL